MTELQQTISTIETWSELNGIKVNKSKSAIIRVRRDKRTRPPQSNSYCGYPVVNSYKYLGLQIDSDLTLTTEKQDMKKKE
jgi:hypothetical protein